MSVTQRRFRLAGLLALALPSLLFAADRGAPAKPLPMPMPVPSARRPAAHRAAVIDDSDSRPFYAYKLSTYLGMSIFRGSALALGTQFGYAPFQGTPFYVGPAVDFALLSPAYLFSTLASAWYELRIYGSPRLSIVAGVLGGVGFNRNISGIRDVVPEGFLQGAIVQDIDDLVSVRGEFRPGIIDGYFAFNMNFDVCFRFY